MIIVNSTYRFDPINDGYEVPGVSLTESGQAMSIKELITRMARGESPNIAMRSEYDYDENYEGFDYDHTSDADYDLADYTADSLHLVGLSVDSGNTGDNLEASQSQNGKNVSNEDSNQGDSVDSPHTPA